MVACCLLADAGANHHQAQKHDCIINQDVASAAGLQLFKL
jgi:hypothetical protein